MHTFKQFLESIMTPEFLTKLINAACERTPRAYVFCTYDEAHVEGFLEGAKLRAGGDIEVDYEWFDDAGMRVPSTFIIDRTDIDRFYFGKYDGRRTLMLRDRVNEGEHQIYAKKIENAPAWSPEHSEGDYTVGDITFSAEHGLGAVPYNRSVNYHGLVAIIRPNDFLKLALPHHGAQDKTARDIARLVKDGYAMGIPFLDISLKDVEDGGMARVTGHEGRGRMEAIKLLHGDLPVPVHLILTGGLRSRHLTSELIEALKGSVVCQDNESVCMQPFKRLYINGKKV